MADVIVGTGAIEIHATSEGLDEEVHAEAEEAGADVEIRIPIELDSEEFQAALDRVKGELEELKSMMVEPKAGLDIDIFQEMLDEIKAQLDELSRRVTEPTAALRADEVYAADRQNPGCFRRGEGTGTRHPRAPRRRGG